MTSEAAGRRRKLSRSGTIRRGRSLARRQALLTAGCTFAAAIIIAATALALTSSNVSGQTLERFRALANERQRQLQMSVANHYETARQVTSRRRLRMLLAEDLASGPDPGRTSEANAILRASAEASERFVRLTVVVQGRIHASSDPSLVGLSDEVPDVVPPGRLEPTITEPYAAAGAVRATVAAPVVLPGGRATVLAEIDAGEMMEILTDTEPLGPGGALRIIAAGTPEFPRAVGAESAEGLPESDFRAASVGGKDVLVYWQPVVFNPGMREDWRLVASLPAASASTPVRRLLTWLLPAVGALTAVVTGLSYAAARRLGRRLERLREVALRGAASGRPEPADVRGNDEVGDLAAALNSLGSRVKKDLSGLRREAELHRGEKDRLSEELSIAGEIQRCLYPAEPLRLPGLEAVGDSIPAEHLCGDYYDYFLVDDSVYFAVGDVSGHGVGPSLLMVEVRSVLRGLRWDCVDLVPLVSRLNERLFRETPPGRFVSLLLGRADLKTGRVEYVGAGHRGLVVRSGGECETLESTGTVVGLVDDVEWASREVQLGEGDLLCVASDGVEEMQDAEGRQFGWPAVCDAVAALRGEPLRDVIERLMNEASAHAHGRPAKDDRTVLLLRRTAGG